MAIKVVHINKTDTGGGAAVAARRIHNSLRKAGVESYMLVQSKRSSDPCIQATSNSFLGKCRSFTDFVAERLTVLPHEKHAALRYNFSIANTGVSIAQHPLVQQADVIHLHWINQGFLSMKSLAELVATGKPIVWTLHDMWPFTGGCHYAGFCLEFNEHCGFCDFLKHPAKNDLSVQIFKRKRALYKDLNLSIVSCSQWLNSFARSSALLRNAVCTSIPNPIDTSIFRVMDKDLCREALGLPKDKKLLLFGAAKVDDIRKGFRYLDEALRIIGDSFPSLANRMELVMFGNQKGKAMQSVFYTHRFDFINDVDTLVMLYNAADAFVLPSLQDNLPNTVVESLACGTPVVGFRIGGVPEMVDHGRTGYLAEVKNSLSLANGIYSMMFFDQENGRSAVAESARHLFAEDHVAAQYVKVYQDALERQKPANG